MNPPLQLAQILRTHRLSLRNVVRKITTQGQTLSATALMRVVNSGHFPTHITEAATRAAIERALTELGVPPEELQTAWQPQVLVTPAAPRAPKQTTPASEISIPETEMLTEDARRHFGLARSPFGEPKSQEDVYVGPDQRFVREAMYQTARHGGFLAVIGASGAGKSTLRRALLDRIAVQNEPIMVCSPQVVNKKELRSQHICEALVRDLSPEAPCRSLEAIARQVLNILRRRSDTQHCLVIEEAHDLHPETLKYLKRFFELEDGFRKLLSIILIGESKLANKLSARDNPDALEVIRRCEIVTLRALDAQLEPYLRHRLGRAGVEFESVFAPNAMEEIRARLTFTDGQNRATLSGVYPLSVQNLVISAMNLAVQTGMPKVDAAVVSRAANW